MSVAPITKHIFALGVAALLLPGCGGYGRANLRDAPKIVNVSSYDPKERQRGGDSYSTSEVSALRRNGALGLIARCGKGGAPDDKCASFLAAANRSGMLLGTYYFMVKGRSPVSQADHYVDLLRRLAPRAAGRRLLLVGDIDTRSTPAEIVAFVNRIEKRTGVLPVIYLENSGQLRAALKSATPAQRRRLRQCPYWLALYSHTSGFETPQALANGSGIWSDWALWQYAGVEWRGRSIPQVYHHGPWRAPKYFGTMDRPLEHNAFNGSLSDLGAFWMAHSWTP